MVIYHSISVYDTVINFLLKIRLWIFVNIFPSKFKNIVNPIQKKNWILSFNDEFEGTTIDKTKWITNAYYGLSFDPTSITENNTAPFEYFSDTAFTVSNSVVKQIADKTDTVIDYTDWNGKDWGKFTIPYTVGQLESVNSFNQQYGYFEARTKIPNTTGMWPAFWLCSTYSWPPEIDIYEMLTSNSTTQMPTNIHYNTGATVNLQSSQISLNTLDCTSSFHIYACSWSKNSIKFYYDNLLVRVLHDPEALSWFKFPMFIIIGTGIEPQSYDSVPLNQTTFPNYHEVDYVRAYKKS